LIQEDNAWRPEVGALSALNFEQDIWMGLTQPDEFIAAAQSRQSDVHDTGFTPMSDMIHYKARDLPTIFGGRSSRGVILANLHAFEGWVGTFLWDWVGYTDMVKSHAARCQH